MGYLAEDTGKNDSYCRDDVQHGAHPDLHTLLFDELGLTHDGSLRYIFFCRAVLGCFVRTKDGSTDLDNPGKAVWASSNRELAIVEGSSPPVHHHALLAEVGQRISTYREFIVFHGDRIYPEYLVAYKR